MNIGENFRSSFKALFHNKLRSFLTMLGVIIGVFSVVMLTSIGEGIKQQVSSQVESLGANLLYVLPGKVDMSMDHNKESKLGVQRDQFGSQNTLTYQDVLNLKGEKHISAVSGVFTGIDQLNDLKIAVSTTGVDEDYIKITPMKMDQGNFISKEQRKEEAKVAVIGHQANKELFDGKNSVGKNFQLNGIEYQVIGILKYKKPENMGPRGEDLNVKIFLPITELLSRQKEPFIGQILVQAKSSQEVEEAEKTIKGALKEKHKTEDFSVLKQQDMLTAINNILGIFTAGLGGIAAISLLVGGIGIMNIMLVSVTERTREIGVRKAIGARRRDIMIQFLIESVILSLIGGLIGLAAGIAGTNILPALIKSLYTAVSLPAVIIALVFSILVGIFFGVYPASKAAKLDPIEALRNE